MNLTSLQIPTSWLKQANKIVRCSPTKAFLAEAVRRQRTGEEFSGVIYVHQLKITIGQCIDDLELISKVYDPEDVVNRIIYLPLQ